MQKRFTFKSARKATRTIGIDAKSLAEAVKVYKKIEPHAQIVLVSTNPSSGFRPVWLSK